MLSFRKKFRREEKLTISHIINPVKTGKSSDLFTAQPITFETMRKAGDFCSKHSGLKIRVTHYTAQFPEDHEVIPSGFLPTPDLERSILDIDTFQVPRKLPLMKDILDRLFQSSDDKYMIYTNADIALQPYFYWTVSEIIRQGHDAFVINRRTIPGHYSHIDELPQMYSEIGKKHPGWDCFVFKRDHYPSYDLGNACIGSGWIGRVMITNMASFSEKFKIFQDLHVTFHIGNETVWQSQQYLDYREHNKNECKKILEDFDQRYGPFDRSVPPGQFIRNYFE